MQEQNACKKRYFCYSEIAVFFKSLIVNIGQNLRYLFIRILEDKLLSV